MNTLPLAEKKKQLITMGFDAAKIDKVLKDYPNTDINDLVNIILNRP